MLLRDTSSGKLVVRRTVDWERAEIYQRLRRIKTPDIPAIYDITEVETGRYEIIEEYIEGIVHRDIKPGNIIVTPDDRLYLIDFDIARLYKKEQVSDTVILGTQGYAAPEQFGFQQTDKRTDIYATGILLNKLLTGKMPQESLPQIRLAQIVLRCTKIDSAERYRNAKELKKALRRYHPRYPKALALIREIPGFRSFKIWKMMMAVCIYGYLGWGFCSFMSGQVAKGEISRSYVIEFTIEMTFLFLFIFDCFRIRSRIRWLEKLTGQDKYPYCCLFVVWMVFLFVSFVFEKFFE